MELKDIKFINIETCEWKTKGNDIWDSECEERFIFNCNTPIENGFRYCPYCGNELREIGETNE